MKSEMTEREKLERWHARMGLGDNMVAVDKASLMILATLAKIDQRLADIQQRLERNIGRYETK